MKIDSHHHLWKYTPDEYGWINDEMSVLRRDFLPADLKPEIARVGVDGVVSVQARQTLSETNDLLDWAEQYDFIRGVVGWVPLVSPAVRSDLEKLASRSALKGIRHVLQDEPDERYMLREDFNRGVALLKEFSLVYDILVYERHLPQTLRFVDRHPGQTFVLDHIAKPRIRDGSLSPWRANITELARRPNVYCKVSGLVTEAGGSWTEQQLIPYLDTVFSVFGPRRLMFGSDWPVCLPTAGYEQWFQVVENYVSALSQTGRERFWSGAAIEAYRLSS